jgi:hypothetical protein
MIGFDFIYLMQLIFAAMQLCVYVKVIFCSSKRFECCSALHDKAMLLRVGGGGGGGVCRWQYFFSFP